MKTTKLKIILAGMCALASIQVQAQDFGGKNGGDVQEKRFYQIAYDLKDWITYGGAKKLKLPTNIDIASYEVKMLNAITSYNVSFTSDTIMVNGVEKDCENTTQVMLIRCNIDRFKNVSESDQYVIVHHEFAGIAGIETNEGKARSNYIISDQITESLEKVTVLKLAVKKATPVTNPACALYAGRKYAGQKIQDFILVSKRSRAEFVVDVTNVLRTWEMFYYRDEASKTKHYVSYVRGSITHRSGFSINIGGRILDEENIKHLIKDPYNVEIEKKMSSANGASEYERLKSLLNPSLNYWVNTKSTMDILLDHLPTCASMK